MAMESVEYLMQRVEELMEEDMDALDEFIEEHEEDYPELLERAFLLAVQKGNMEFVETHIDDVELNNGDDGNSEYLYETDSQEMKELLMDYGALYSWGDYEDCRFAVETTEQTIIALSEGFQEEVYEKYKEKFNLTDGQISSILEEEANDSSRDVARDMEALGVSFSDGVPTFGNKYGDDGYELMELLEELGWECDFEGNSWKFETTGVYFIK